MIGDGAISNLTVSNGNIYEAVQNGVEVGELVYVDRTYTFTEVPVGKTPSWLLDFTDTGDEIVTSDTAFRLFAKDFSADIITLGGNDSGGGYRMYTVVIVD